jgi:hypothetical protein
MRVRDRHRLLRRGLALRVLLRAQPEWGEAEQRRDQQRQSALFLVNSPTE